MKGVWPLVRARLHTQSTVTSVRLFKDSKYLPVSLSNYNLLLESYFWIEFNQLDVTFIQFILTYGSNILINIKQWQEVA